MRAFGRDASIYKEKVVRTQCLTTNVPQITRTFTKITIKLKVNFCCYEDLSFNLLEIGESQTFAKLGVKRAGPLRFSPGMDVVFLLLLALALTLDGSPVATAKQSALFFLKITLSIRRGAGKCEGKEKSFLHVSPQYLTPRSDSHMQGTRREC